MNNPHALYAVTSIKTRTDSDPCGRHDTCGRREWYAWNEDQGPAHARRRYVPHLNRRGALTAALIAVLPMLGIVPSPGDDVEPGLETSSPQIQTKRLAAEYHQDFRSGDFDFRGLRLEGSPGVADLIKMERGGLRIMVPPGLGKPVGVTTRFHIRGDFEITAKFEVPPGMRPRSGSSMKAELYIRPEGDWGNYASIVHDLKPEGMSHSFGRGSNDEGQRRHAGKRIPTKARSGVFRLVRTGSTLHYLLAEGDDDTFREVFQAELWPGDVERARIAAIAEGPQTPAQVIWKDLTIRAEALPGLVDGAPDPTGVSWWLLTGGLVVLLCGGLAWVSKRHPRRVSPRPSIRK